MPTMRRAEAVGNVSSKGSLGGPRGTELVGLGIFLAAAFLVPFMAGLALDALMRTSPLLLFVGLVVGIAAAVFGGYQRLKRHL
jgi:hypothetical protein